MRRRIVEPQVWVLVAYFLLALFAVLVVRQSRIANHANQVALRDQAIRIADQRAAAHSAKERCLASIPTLRHAEEFLAGVRELHTVLLENAAATHRATPPGTPLYRAQKRSIMRLRRSLILVRAADFSVPTKAECRRVTG